MVFLAILLTAGFVIFDLAQRSMVEDRNKRGQSCPPYLRVVYPSFRSSPIGPRLILMAENMSFTQTSGSHDGQDNFESWRCTRKINKKHCPARVHKKNGIYYLTKEHTCTDIVKK